MREIKIFGIKFKLDSNERIYRAKVKQFYKEKIRQLKDELNSVKVEYQNYIQNNTLDMQEADEIRGEIYHYSIDMDSEDPKVFMINQIKPNTKVLDVGCACGDLGKKLKNLKNTENFGLEYNFQSVEIAKQNGSYKKVIQCDLNKYKNISFKKEEFDYIVFGDVLEHIYEPKKVLEYFKTFLKKDGYFLLSIPNIAHASIKANLLLNNFDYTPSGILDQTHIRFFTYKTILNILSDLNLEIADCQLTHFWGINGSQENNPYPDLPQEIRKFILKDKHSSIVQYVLKCKKSNCQDLMVQNSARIQKELNNTPYTKGAEQYLY